MGKRVLVAMSGGVDSSVAAYLLLEQGYECIGATMRLYDNDLIDGANVPPNAHTCCSLDDVEDARSVAYRLGIPYHVMDFGERFEECVVEKFVDAYENGRTPNPCIDCNRYLKFDALLKKAMQLDCDYIATGHYARIMQDPSGRYSLRRGIDAQKDQSYVLYSLTQEQLAHTLLPLGELDKPEVRRIAEEQGFINARKHDSQDICFVPDGNYGSFLERYTGKSLEPGNVLDQQGNVVGTHDGAQKYTIGQRKGLGVAMGYPAYVTDKDMAANTVTIGPKQALLSKGCYADDWNWIGQYQGEPMQVMVKSYYRQKPHAAWLTLESVGCGTDGSCRGDGDRGDGGERGGSSGGSGEIVKIEYEEPSVKAVAGQAVVAYIGDSVLGGGTVTGYF